LANPGTITGSIGVILRGNNLSKLLKRIGVSFETVKSGLYKDILSPDRALTDAERELLQSLIDSSYDQFVEAVATGRGLDQTLVRGFADGRVFSGAQAKQLGLVDALGDEETARRLAAELAGLDPEKTRPITFGSPPKRFGGLLPGRSQLRGLLQALSLELAWTGQPLWLYRP
jgi:protease-4